MQRAGIEESLPACGGRGIDTTAPVRSPPRAVTKVDWQHTPMAGYQWGRYKKPGLLAKVDEAVYAPLHVRCCGH